MNLEVLARLLAAAAQGAREAPGDNVAVVIGNALHMASQEALILSQRGAEDAQEGPVPRRWAT